MSDITEFLKSVKDGTATATPSGYVSMGNPILGGVIAGGVPVGMITRVHGQSVIGRQDKYLDMGSRLTNGVADTQETCS